MIIEKGTLPVGIEKDGVFHRDFEIRPALVRDTIEVADEQEPEKLKNNYFFGVCLTAKQLVRIGDISPVPADDVAGMFDMDLDEITEAKERLAVRLRSFHAGKGDGQGGGPVAPAEGPKPEETGPGPAQDAGPDGSGS